VHATLALAAVIGLTGDLDPASREAWHSVAVAMT
jgi:hypothetical protein